MAIGHYLAAIHFVLPVHDWPPNVHKVLEQCSISLIYLLWRETKFDYIRYVIHICKKKTKNDFRAIKHVERIGGQTDLVSLCHTHTHNLYSTLYLLLILTQAHFLFARFEMINCVPVLQSERWKSSMNRKMFRLRKVCKA